MIAATTRRKGNKAHLLLHSTVGTKRKQQDNLSAVYLDQVHVENANTLRSTFF
eukprot:GSA120T00013512001.1